MNGLLSILAGLKKAKPAVIRHRECCSQAIDDGTRARATVIRPDHSRTS
jgi:hypothetical protein